MPLVLYLPANHPRFSLRRRAQAWLAAQSDEYGRARRFLHDRRHLLALEARLLGDVGLTREDVLRGVPFQHDD